jgi:hypothetical protein
VSPVSDGRATRLVRDHRPLIIGFLVVAAIVAIIVPLALLPRWEMRAVPGFRNLGLGVPSWSPSGRYLAWEETATVFDVATADGRAVLSGMAGTSPVWLDDQTIAMLEQTGSATGQLVLISVPSGERRVVGPIEVGGPMPPDGPYSLGRLVADGRGHLAHQRLDDPVKSAVVDPETGANVAKVGGRPLLWTPDGSLVVKVPIEDLVLANAFYRVGTLAVWTQERGTTPLAAGYVEVTDQPSLSPDGSNLACICVPIDALPTRASEALLVVPLDGSSPEVLNTAGPFGFQGPAWVDDHSVAAVDDSGLQRQWINHARTAIFVRPPRVPRAFFNAHVAHLAAGTAVIWPKAIPDQTGPLDTTEWRLDVYAPDGTSLFTYPMTSINFPSISVGPDDRTAILTADPQVPGDVPRVVYRLSSP